MSLIVWLVVILKQKPVDVLRHLITHVLSN